MIATAYPTYSPDEPAGLTQNRIPEADINTSLLPSFRRTGYENPATSRSRQAGSFGDLPLVRDRSYPRPKRLARVRLHPFKKQIAAIILKVTADQATLSSKGVFKVARTL